MQLQGFSRELLQPNQIVCRLVNGKKSLWVNCLLIPTKKVSFLLDEWSRDEYASSLHAHTWNQMHTLTSLYGLITSSDSLITCTQAELLLACTYEEANTRLKLHGAHVSLDGVNLSLCIH